MPGLASSPVQDPIQDAMETPAGQGSRGCRDVSARHEEPGLKPGVLESAGGLAWADGAVEITRQDRVISALANLREILVSGLLARVGDMARLTLAQARIACRAGLLLVEPFRGVGHALPQNPAKGEQGSELRTIVMWASQPGLRERDCHDCQVR
jgi:hypothetical protein